MKPAAVNENDLLALIEGDLDAVRSREVLAALAKDPRMIKRVEAMQADREVLRGLFADVQMAAPGGLVRDAISIAERDGLVIEAPKPAAANIVVKRRLIARPMAAGLALAAMVGVLGAGAMVIFSMSKSEEQLAANLSDSPEYFFSIPSEQEEEPVDTSAQLVEKLFSGASSANTEALDRLALLLANENEPQGEELAGPVENAVMHGPSLRRETAQLWEGMFEDTAQGLTVYEAAQLVMENRLELIITANDPRAWTQASGQALAMGELRPTTGQPVSASSGSREVLHFTLEITVPWDPNLTALQDELLRLRGRVSRRVGVSQAMFQAVTNPAPSETQDSSSEQQLSVGVLPSREVQHVLWWTRPASTWERHLSVRVPIIIVPTDDAP